MEQEWFEIEWYYDGWAVYAVTSLSRELVARWDHDDENMGTKGVADLIRYITGNDPKVEECY